MRQGQQDEFDTDLRSAIQVSRQYSVSAAAVISGCRGWAALPSSWHATMKGDNSGWHWSREVCWIRRGSGFVRFIRFQS